MVNKTKPELTNLQRKIFRFLSINAGISFNSARLAKHLDVSQPAVLKSLPNIIKMEMVKQTKDESGKKLYEFNRDNQRIMLLKRADNLRFIYEIGLDSFLEENFPGATIILFGSFSRGEDNSNSDIDIAIIGRKEKSIDLSRFKEILKKEIVINFYPSFPEIHKDLRENLCNGIVLSGGISL